jgi:manganese transport protein
VILKKLFEKHAPKFGGLEILKYIGPGFLVTVGFIDPGNWASNVAAGSGYGYSLLWMVTLSTLMLIILQHTAAHLGIATGLCLSEASAKYLGKWTGRIFLLTAVIASVSTALAEVLGAAIGLNMLLGITHHRRSDSLRSSGCLYAPFPQLPKAGEMDNSFCLPHRAFFSL